MKLTALGRSVRDLAVSSRRFLYQSLSSAYMTLTAFSRVVCGFITALRIGYMLSLR